MICLERAQRVHTTRKELLTSSAQGSLASYVASRVNCAGIGSASGALDDLDSASASHRHPDPRDRSLARREPGPHVMGYVHGMGQALHCRYMAVTKPLRYDHVTYTHVSAPEFHEDSITVLKST